MKKFVNKYLYTPELARTAILVWWWNKYRVALIVCIGMLVGFGIEAVILQSALWLIPGFVGNFGLLMFAVQALRAIRTEREGIRKKFHIDSPMMRIEIGDELTVSIGNTKNRAELSSLIGCRETKQLLVLILQGNMTLPLKKDAFQKGSVEECRAWADSVIAENRARIQGMGRKNG